MALLIIWITLSTKMPQERACKPQQLELVLHSVVNATAPANVRAVEFTFSMNGLVELDRAEAIRCFSELFSTANSDRELMRVRVDPEEKAVRISIPGFHNWLIPCNWISKEI